jgi:hypothetical protein
MNALNANPTAFDRDLAEVWLEPDDLRHAAAALVFRVFQRVSRSLGRNNVQAFTLTCCIALACARRTYFFVSPQHLQMML